MNFADLVTSPEHAEQAGITQCGQPALTAAGPGWGEQDTPESSVGKGLLVTGHQRRSHGMDGAMESK